MNKNYTIRIARGGVMAAVIAALTTFPQIHIPFTNGYIHLGDAAIFIAAVVLRPFEAAFAAGMGSMSADIISGYPHWALPTLIIKSLMGFVVGSLLTSKTSKTIKTSNTAHNPKNLLAKVPAFAAGGAIMIAGYYTASSIIYSNWITPLSSLFANFMQFAGGLVVSLFVLKMLPQSLKQRK